MNLKTRWSFFLFLASISISNAQFRLLKSIDEVEITAGPSIESLRGRDDPEENVTKISYAGYLGATWVLSEKGSLKIKVGYHKKGQNREFITNYYDTSTQQSKKGESSIKQDLDYIVIPATYTYLPFTKRIPFWVEGGLFFSVLKKALNTRVDSYDGVKESTNLIDFFEKYDAGLCISSGYKFQSDNQYSISFILSYQHGFVDISKFTNTTYNELKSNSLTFAISFSRKNRKD